MHERTNAVLIAIAALAAIAITCALGNWQLRRADEKAAMQAARDSAAARPAIDLARPPSDPADLIGHRVRLRGVVDPVHTVFIDNRTRQGIAGFHVLSPVRIAGSERVAMVLRGWIASDPAHRSRPPVLDDDGAVRVFEGIAEPGLPAGLQLGSWSPGGPQDRVWPYYEAAQFAHWSGLEPLPWVLRELGGADDGLARDWARPGDGTERHRAYALQWYTSSVVIALLWFWHGFWRPRQRRAADGRRPPEP